MDDDITADSQAVQGMAKRIAQEGAQTFDKTDDFGKKYGAKAYAMLEKGGLMQALADHGIDVTPAGYAGPGFTVPVGIKLTPRSE